MTTDHNNKGAVTRAFGSAKYSNVSKYRFSVTPPDRQLQRHQSL